MSAKLQPVLNDLEANYKSTCYKLLPEVTMQKVTCTNSILFFCLV